MHWRLLHIPPEVRIPVHLQAGNSSSSLYHIGATTTSTSSTTMSTPEVLHACLCSMFALVHTRRYYIVPAIRIRIDLEICTAQMCFSRTGTTSHPIANQCFGTPMAFSPPGVFIRYFLLCLVPAHVGEGSCICPLASLSVCALTVRALTVCALSICACPQQTR